MITRKLIFLTFTLVGLSFLAAGQVEARTCVSVNFNSLCYPVVPQPVYVAPCPCQPVITYVEPCYPAYYVRRAPCCYYPQPVYVAPMPRVGFGFFFGR